METWDLYDKNRQLLKCKIARGEKLPAGCYHIVVHVCFFSNEGKMLIQHRQPFKDGWPNMWDIGVGGSALEGESPQDAAHRETGEEIGYDMCFDDRRAFVTSNHGSCFVDFFVVNQDLDINKLTPQPEEVSELMWADEAEILSMIDRGEFVPYNKSLISFLFSTHDKNTIFDL